jgi:hypothetical protein
MNSFNPFLLYIDIDPDKKNPTDQYKSLVDILKVEMENSTKGIRINEQKDWRVGFDDVSNYFKAGECYRQSARTPLYMLEGVTNPNVRGCHVTADGTTSTNVDYLLSTGHVVNSLCIYYLENYADCIPEIEWVRLSRFLGMLQHNKKSKRPKTALEKLMELGKHLK